MKTNSQMISYIEFKMSFTYFIAFMIIENLSNTYYMLSSEMIVFSVTLYIRYISRIDRILFFVFHPIMM